MNGEPIKDLVPESDRLNATVLLLSELLFVALPLLVVCLVLWVQERPSQILRSPEWSFAAAVLFGQTLVRFVKFSAVASPRLRWERVVGTVAALVVLGLVPALLLLGLIMADGVGGARLTIAQLVIATTGVVLFFAIGHPAELSIGNSTLLRRLRMSGRGHE